MWSFETAPLTETWQPFAMAALYLIVIFGLQSVMQQREPIVARLAFAAHNLFLCLLSALMLYNISKQIYANVSCFCIYLKCQICLKVCQSILLRALHLNNTATRNDALITTMALYGIGFTSFTFPNFTNFSIQFFWCYEKYDKKRKIFFLFFNALLKR